MPPRILLDFKKPFCLYIDGLKEYSFRVTLHQLNIEGRECLILFLLKHLLLAEQNY